MEASVQRTHSKPRVCEARTVNDLLVVFVVPPDGAVRLGDKLEFGGLKLNADVLVKNLSLGKSFSVYIREDDIHDLRLPAKHGGSRQPSQERLGAA